MKRTLLMIMVGLVLLTSSPAQGGGQQAELYKDKYFAIVTTPDSASYNPTWSGSWWTWPLGIYTGPYGYGIDLPLTGTVVTSNQSLLLGLENLYVSANVKDLTVTISYTGAGPLLLQKASSGSSAGPSAGSKVSETNSSGAYTLVYRFNPQPGWEWVLIRNTAAAPVTLTSVAINSSCTPSVPPVIAMSRTCYMKLGPNNWFYHIAGGVDGAGNNYSVTLTLYDAAHNEIVGAGATIVVTDGRSLWSKDWAAVGGAKYVKATLTDNPGVQSELSLDQESPLSEQVPALSQWGVVALIICLVATAIWVIRKRKMALARSVG